MKAQSTEKFMNVYAVKLSDDDAFLPLSMTTKARTRCDASLSFGLAVA